MSHALCKSTVLKIYQDVMDDVIGGVRDMLLEDGVDETVLQELKSVWEQKLLATKAVSQEEEKKKPEPATNGFAKQAQQVVAPAAANLVPQLLPTQMQMVPIQITLPPQPGPDGGQARVLTIQVPGSALQGNQLQKVLTGPVITATMNLPAPLAATVLQQHVNAAFASLVPKTVVQTDGAQDDVGEDGDDGQVEIEFILPASSSSKKCRDKTSKASPSSKGALLAAAIRQTDGPLDTSDEEEDGSDNDDDDDDLDDDKDEDDQEMEDDAGEEEPLNSEDDVTDDDPSDLFDTDNIVVCQYDKIIRNRNKWKFYLKDGIMNLNGQDYVFQKANGDAEW